MPLMWMVMARKAKHGHVFFLEVIGPFVCTKFSICEVILGAFISFSNCEFCKFTGT